MHTFVSNGVRFHYNLDLSGDVEIRVDRPEVDQFRDGSPENGESLKIPAAALLAFVAEHIRNRKISKMNHPRKIARMERATVEQILGIEEGK